MSSYLYIKKQGNALTCYVDAGTGAILPITSITDEPVGGMPITAHGDLALISALDQAGAKWKGLPVKFIQETKEAPVAVDSPELEAKVQEEIANAPADKRATTPAAARGNTNVVPLPHRPQAAPHAPDAYALLLGKVVEQFKMLLIQNRAGLTTKEEVEAVGNFLCAIEPQFTEILPHVKEQVMAPKKFQL
jgi:hypothetical protein